MSKQVFMMMLNQDFLKQFYVKFLSKQIIGSESSSYFLIYFRDIGINTVLWISFNFLSTSRYLPVNLYADQI